ncbi:hypothetical protein PENTCL1PPCAC_2762, partial [Pristionchus entomophagus]
PARSVKMALSTSQVFFYYRGMRYSNKFRWHDHLLCLVWKRERRSRKDERSRRIQGKSPNFYSIRQS